MGDVAVQVENLSKRYEIGSAKRRHDTLRDLISYGVKETFSRNGRSRQQRNFVWAINDVSFEIKQGDVVGIIGRNGAGKSTLLKILSRITAPTSGYAEIHGRVGSLLEVGTGFHQELTGRENIYLNGAILGMKKAEIDRNFDAIVAFAETEKFLDTPVKHYSSGMYVRLAFAVAAHLDPEILIVDEVLAVGDTQFQKKCLGKMQDISKSQGRTVLFVSHNMDAVQRLCSKCLMFEEGRLVASGDTAATVSRYLSSHSAKAAPNEWIDVSRCRRTGSGEVRFVEVRYSSLSQAVDDQPYSTGPLEFLLAIESDATRSVGSLAITLYSPVGTKLVNADTVLLGRTLTLRKGLNLVKLRIEKLHLNPGLYAAGLWLANPIGSRSTGGEYDHIESAFEIEVVPRAGGSGCTRDSDGFVACQFDVVDFD